MTALYVLDVEEFRPLVDAARAMPDCTVTEARRGYVRIESPGEIVFDRRAMKVKPAIWYSMFNSGIEAEIVDYGHDVVRLAQIKNQTAQPGTSKGRNP